MLTFCLMIFCLFLGFKIGANSINRDATYMRGFREGARSNYVANGNKIHVVKPKG